MGNADRAAFAGPRLDEGTLANLRRIISDTALPGEDLPARIVAQFASDARVRLASLRARLAQGDCDGVVEVAHALKGGSATVGAARVQAVATFVELQARDGTIAPLKEVLDELAREVEETTLDLAQALGGGARAGALD